MRTNAKLRLTRYGIFAATVLILLPGIAAASGTTIPARIGPIVKIAAGPGWALTGWRSATGLCLSYRSTPMSIVNCNLSLQRSGHSLPSSFWIVGGNPKQLIIVGVVAPIVARCTAEGRNLKPTLVRIVKASASLRRTARFFRVAVRAGLPLRWSVNCYAANGKSEGAVQQGIKH